MELNTAQPSAIELIDAPSPHAAPTPRRELADEVLRASTVDDAFRLARSVYPLPLSMPPGLREALFVRTAKDHILEKVLLLSVRGERDLLQDLLTWWWAKGLDGFDPEKASVRTYLRTVIARMLLNGRRKEIRWSKIQGVASDELVSRVSDELMRGVDVEALARLSIELDACLPADAMAWLLAAVPECSNEEIARVTGIPLGAVSRHVARVRKRLARRYGSPDHGLAALLPLAMLRPPSALERLKDLASLALSYARRALATTAGKLASYALVAAAGAGTALTAVAPPPPRVIVQRVFVQPSPPAAAPARVEAPTPVSAPTPASPATPPAPQISRSGAAGSHDEISDFQRASAVSSTRPAVALRLLADHRRRWPTSELALTRDAMEAELLARTGETERARTVAQRVVAQSPQSPEAARVRELARAEPTP